MQNQQEEILAGLIEISLAEPDNFLKVKETLTRMGVASANSNKLYQSAHILHKRGKYYILHFKSLFSLDGKPTNITEDDVARTNTIANMLAEWKLVTLVTPDKSKTPVVPISKIKIIPFKEKGAWELVAKYTIGNAKQKEATAK